MPIDQHKLRSILKRSPLVAILRGMTPDDTVSMASSLWAAGVHLVEIPLHSPTSFEAFREAQSARHHFPDAALGMGSVRNLDDYTRARDAGAEFTVSPGLFSDVCEQSLGDGIAHLPGVFTATEVGQALSLGFTTMKLFPASTLGPSGLAALRDPFPDAEMVAVGGINTGNAAEYIRSGAIAVGIGSALATMRGDTETFLTSLQHTQ